MEMNQLEYFDNICLLSLRYFSLILKNSELRFFTEPPLKTDFKFLDQTKDLNILLFETLIKE